MLLTTLLHHRTRRSRRSPHRPPRRRLELELLEGRSLLSGLTHGGLTLGPLVQVTGPSPFGGSSVEAEPYFAVNPTNPKNMVGVWTQDKRFDGGGGGLGIGVAVTLNGGNTWTTGLMPGLTKATGGTLDVAFDSWLSFAPNGDLYFSADVGDRPVHQQDHPTPNAILVEKSTDGGRTWSDPITLIRSDTQRIFNDAPSITADPTAVGYAYAVWCQLRSSGGVAMFTSTTDGGQSWDAPSTIFDPGGGTDACPQIVVLPDGTLIDFMNVGQSQNSKKTQTLSLLRSSDKGRTWLPAQNPIQVGSMLPIGITDPDTGQAVAADSPTIGLFSAAVDPHNGNLYAVWEDARFSNSQYDSIAFSMSTDGGFTWSTPIQVNQTPTNAPAGDRQAFLPSVAVAADGAVAVTYYDFRLNDGNPGLLTDYWLVEGRTGTDLTNPANWHAEARLTNTSFDMETAAIWTDRGFWLGEYQGLAAAGNSFDAFFAATNGTDPGDIYFRDPVATPSAGPAPTSGALKGDTDPSHTPNPSAWAMYNRDPLGTRNNTAEHTLSPANVGQLGVAWNYPTAAPVAGTPAVADGVVYAGDEAGNFYAVNADNGRLLWQKHIFGPVTDSALVTRGTVVFGDLAGFIYGLDAESGATRWMIPPSQSIRQTGIWGSATQVGKYVAIGVASNEDYSLTTTQYTANGSVILLDPADGHVVWQTYIIPDAAYAAGWRGATVWSTPAYDRENGLIYVSTGNYSQAGSPGTDPGVCDAVLALDARTGAVRWTTQVVTGDIWNRRDFDDGSREHPDADFGDSPKIFHLADGTKVVSAGSKNGSYYVMNAATGALVNGPDGLRLESVYGLLGGLFANGAVDDRAGLAFANGLNWPNLFGPGTGDLYALSADGKHVLWDFQTAPPNGPNGSGVAIANGVVYFQSLDGNLYALDEHATSADTALLARIQTGGTWSGPAISHGHVYEGTGDALRYFFVDPNLFSSGGIICLGLPSEDLPEGVADRSVALIPATREVGAGPRTQGQVNREVNSLVNGSALYVGLFIGGPVVGAGHAGAAGALLAAALAPCSPAPTVIPAPAAMTPATVAPPSLSGATDPVVPPPARVTGTPTAAPARRAAPGPADDWGPDVLMLAVPS
jgi:outer membrane protein assembly factor BamB